MSGLSQSRRRAWHPRALNITVAAGLFAVTLMTTAAGPSQFRGHLSLSAVSAAGAAYSALVFRRRWPWATLLVAASGAEVYMMLSHAYVGVFAAPLIALYTVAESTARRRIAVSVGGLIVLALAGFHALIRPEGWLSSDNLALAALGSLALAAGDASRSRRAYIAEVEERARRAETDRQREARRQVAEERVRIARDLHDAIGHRIALMKVQADVAEHLFESDPGQCRRAISHVRQESKAALDELRGTVGLLRHPGESLEPVAGLAGLESLVTSFVRSGLRVSRETSGTVRPIPRSADVTAYRVIQEALTNASKHAGDASVRVSLEYQPGRLSVVVDDDGPGPPVGGRSGGGYGITGIRERVCAAGGHLSVGPKVGQGFRVSAILPLPPSPQAGEA